MKKTKIDFMNLNAASDQGVPSSGGEDEPRRPAELTGEGRKVKSGKAPLLIIGLTGFVLLAAAIAGAAYLGYLPLPGSPRDRNENPGLLKQAEMGPTIKLGPLVVNLREENGANYIKTTLFLEIGQKEWVEEIQSRISSLIDLIISTLCDKKLEEMRRPEFKEELKKELLTKINPPQGVKKVKQIYFDEFLYQ